VTTQVPLWAALLIGLGGGGVAGILTLVGVFVKGIFDRKSAVEANQIEQTKLDDEWFKHALDLARSLDNHGAVRQGEALLGALASSGRLSATNATLVAETVTRLQIQPILEAAERAEQAGEPAELFLTAEEE